MRAASSKRDSVKSASPPAQRPGLDLRKVRRLAAQALAEDIGTGDVTTAAVCPRRRRARAILVARQAGVIAGLPVAESVFRRLDPDVEWQAHVRDADRVTAGQLIVRVLGDHRLLLQGERTALNFLQHLSGIATLTARYVEAVAGYPAQIMDTRKTTPGLRMLEKYAVHCGGGVNHRAGLYDQVLIKDNHIKVAGGIARAMAAARRRYGRRLCIEVETETLDDVRAARRAGADVIMLDDMARSDVRAAVALIRGRIPLEASGSVRLENVRAIAATGVDRISVGALTHSAPALDLALDFE